MELSTSLPQTGEVSGEDIFLVGPKHSGKTSAGKALAVLCSRDFIDLDDLIAQRTGKTPRELYNDSPEIFREAEADALEALVKSRVKGRIIATGGGVIDNSRAKAMLKNEALLVYLELPAGSSWRRITNSGVLPPFLKTNNPEETHRVLHEQRSAAYCELAKIIIKAENKNPEEIANEILNLLRNNIES